MNYLKYHTLKAGSRVTDGAGAGVSQERAIYVPYHGGVGLLLDCQTRVLPSMVPTTAKF